MSCNVGGRHFNLSAYARERKVWATVGWFQRVVAADAEKE